MSWVGSGIKDVDKLTFRDMADNESLVGSFVDIQYNMITNSDGAYSLRHPVFLKFRHDKDKADDIDLSRW